MRTSGSGTEGASILVGLGLLMLAGIAVMGGPHNFFQAANRFLINGAERLVLWVQAHW